MTCSDTYSPDSSEILGEAVSLRRDLHRHPELAFNERRTADLVASILTTAGLKVHRGLAGTGVVGTLTRGTGRRAIAIRADMDALPIKELSECPHSSTVPSVMHACGHDGHVAIALAAARSCARLSDIDGTVHFIFQPAEENECGGQRMVEEGVFRHFPSDAIYALHNWPALPVGTCVALDGPMMAALGLFEIVVSGRGCHAAMPHEGADCIVAASQIVSALQSIVSRSVDPMREAVVSVTQINAGDTWNVIPANCVIRGTTRWFDDAVGDILEQRMSTVSMSIASGFGCNADVRYMRRIPATINDPDAANTLRSVAQSTSVGLSVVDARPSMGSEDFAFMLKAAKGSYLWLGAARQGQNPSLHSPLYDFNDDLVPWGVRLWTSLVQRSLART